ncbi:MAG: hypothetical protein V4760_04545 [Bdellovibrionota bacterium]
MQPWVRPSQIESILTFFLMLGFKTAGELARFTLASFQERWGETGVIFWQRLHAQDRQVISPLVPTDPLEDYVHLDFPVTLVSLLLHHTDKSLDYLFSRLSGRRMFARKLVVTLHCEYSETKYKVEIEPNVPSRDRTLFATLLENRLSELDLQNPIRDFEVAIVPCPEKSHQLDFFEPRTTDQDKLQTLFSLLLQSSIKPGLYEIEASVLPERSWRIVSEPKADSGAYGSVTETTAVHKSTQRYPQLAGGGKRMVAAGKRIKRKPERAAVRNSWATLAAQTNEPAIMSQPKYGENVMTAPRPTRVLKRPVPLTIEDSLAQPDRAARERMVGRRTRVRHERSRHEARLLFRGFARGPVSLDLPGPALRRILPARLLRLIFWMGESVRSRHGAARRMKQQEDFDRPIAPFRCSGDHAESDRVMKMAVREGPPKVPPPKGILSLIFKVVNERVEPLTKETVMTIRYTPSALMREQRAKRTRVQKHEASQELFFACVSFVVLLVVALADVTLKF